jgi:hypothetical protein
MGLKIVRKSLFYKGDLLFQLADHVGHWTYQYRVGKSIVKSSAFCSACFIFAEEGTTELN